jgi:type I restriction enzyme, S subunit
MSNSREFVMCNVLWTDYQPTDWVIQPVWQVFKIGRGRVIAETELNPNGTYPVYSSQTKNNGCLGFIDTYDFDCTQITWTTDGANAGTVFLRRGKHNCTNVCGTLLPLKPDRHDINFYTFFLSYVTQFYKRPDTNGAKIMNGEMAAIRLAVPSFNEQRQIAAYLKRETAKIDRLIAKQQKLIKLLQEKRQAVIRLAVTKGLDPNVKMKDSGVEWLGQVPEHWTQLSIRHLTQILRGKFTHRPRNDPAFYDGDFPFIQTGDITKADKYITCYKQTLNEKGASVSRQFPSGTLVMAIAANIGDVGIINFSAYFPDSIVGLVPRDRTNIDFLFYLMQALKPSLIQNATVSTQMNLNADQIARIMVVCPPLHEQIEIVNFVEANLNLFNRLSEKAQNAQDLLKEHRQALITAAVTGKIDVRGLVTDEEVAALDADPVLETTEEDFESEVAEADYITEEE